MPTPAFNSAKFEIAKLTLDYLVKLQTGGGSSALNPIALSINKENASDLNFNEVFDVVYKAIEEKSIK